MDLISFLLGKKYGESNKQGKRKLLALIAIFLLMLFAFEEFVLQEYLLLSIAIALALFLYFKFVRS